MANRQLFKKPQLTLAEVAKEAGFSERSISTTLNQELGKNYFQFVNEFRVEEVKRKLHDPNNDHLKILSLAYEAGFNSKASFNRIFKDITGLTPQQFKKGRESVSMEIASPGLSEPNK